MHGQFGHCKNRLKLTSSNLKGSYYSRSTHVFTFSMGGKACSPWQQLPSVCLTSFLQFTAQYGQAPFALVSCWVGMFFWKNCWFCREEAKLVGERSACKDCINLCMIWIFMSEMQAMFHVSSPCLLGTINFNTSFFGGENKKQASTTTTNYSNQPPPTTATHHHQQPIKLAQLYLWSLSLLLFQRSSGSSHGLWHM